MTGRFVLAGLAAPMLAGCGAEPQLPEIARGLPSNYAEGEAIFDARLKSRFPVGTQEEKLVNELSRQGFPIPPVRDSQGNAYSEFTRSDFIFQTIWSVRWRAEDGRIAEIWGVYGGRGP